MKNHAIDRVNVGHNNAEVYIRLGEFVLIMPPAVMKKLQGELAALLIEIEPAQTAKKQKEKKKEPIAKQILKALYKGKNVTKSLVAINTSRKKKLPDR